MVLEVATLNVKPGSSILFEEAFKIAEKIIAKNEGYLSHQLQKCMEQENKYILLVNWQNLSSHTEGFRNSPAYQEWKKLLHHFYEPFPTVEHYQIIK
jgi:heme-degrading monooxygenase HmoA